MILTVNQQLNAGVDLLLGDVIEGPADVKALIVRLNGRNPQV